MRKRLGIVLLVLIGTFILSGCAPVYAVIDQLAGDQIVEDTEAVIRIAFSNGDVTETKDILSVEDFTAYDIAFSSYRSSILYNTLSSDEQLIYHAYEYALENGYTNILFDEGIATNEERMTVILEFLALDSPLLEQNLRYDVGGFTIYYPITIWDLYEREVSFTGHYITVYNFEQQWWDKKLSAIEKAKSIVADVKDIPSEADKAEQLYRYLCESIEYTEYDDVDEYTVYPYLSDALLEGKSHCDGFANALSLLYNLADIECVEKQYTNSSDDDPGHTWNSAKIDDVWYNMDATLSSWIPDKDCDMHAGIGFAYPDVLQTVYPDHSDAYSPCTETLYVPIDAHLAADESDRFVEEALSAYHTHDDQWAFVLMDAFSEDALDGHMQQIANRLYSTIYYASVPVAEERTAVLIYSSELYNR